MTSSRLGPRTTLRVVILLALSAIFFAPGAFAQLPQAGDTTSPPTPGVGHDYIHAPEETVNPANGSVSIRIPVRMPSGRELTIPFSIAYDSAGAFYYGQTSQIPSPHYATITNVPFSQGGWSYSLPLLTSATQTWTVNPSGMKNLTCTEAISYVFQDPTGNRHNMGLAVINDKVSWGQYCGGTGSSILQGGEGPILATTQDWGQPVIVTDGNGTVYSFASLGGVPSSITDRNGNAVSISGTSGSASVTDTVGRTAVSVPTFGSSPDNITVAGLASAYQVSWTTASASFTINTFNLPGFTACPTSMSGSAKAVSQILLPNGQKYALTYDSTYGMLNKITYPSGGYVRYVWGLNSEAELFSGAQYNSSGVTIASYDCRHDWPAITDRYVSFDGTTEVLHQHFSYSTSWSGGSSSYTSKTTTVTTYDLVRSTNFSTVYTYSAVQATCVPDLNPNANDDGCVGDNDAEQIPVEQTIQYNNVGGSTLKTVTKSWANHDVRTLSSEQTTLDNGQSSLKIYCYNTSEEPTETDEYDLGTAAVTPPSCSNGVPSGATAGSLLRKTATAYATFTGAHIVDLPSSVITYNGSGTRVAETDSSYDQSGLQSTSVVQHVTAPGGSARGNLTTVTKQCFIGSTACAIGNPATTYTYYDTGQIYQMTDPKLNVTTYSYTDSYTPCSGTAPPSGATNAYLTTVTYPQTNSVNHIETYCHDYAKGLMFSSTDENSQTSTYAYVDSLDRLTQASYPDGGQTTYSYNDTPPSPTQTATKKLNSSQSVTTVSTMNGLGAVIQTQLTSDPQGTITTKKTLDGLGRDYTVYNPYRSTSDPTYGYATYVYDALGRTTTVTKQDSSVVTTQYCGQETLVTDEASHWRRSKTDGLGRLIEVDEPNSTTATVNVCPGTGEPIWVTTYTNDALNNLTAVVQGGSHNRSFVYDSLKHLVQSTNPESGVICYGTLSGSTCQQNGYDLNGNVVYKTDARSITTTAAYDALNRVTGLTYSNSDPSVSYTYDQDQSTCLGLGQNNCYNIGHRTTMTDAGGTENLAYDKMGRELVEQRITNSVTKSTTYTYDLAGDLATLTYPTGRIITYTYDSAGRPSDAVDTTNSINYAVGSCSNGAASPTTGTCYAPQGAVAQIKNGTNLVSTYLFNVRLQPCWMYATTGTALATNTSCTATDPGPGNILDLQYNFNSGHDNGNVYGITNNRDSTRTQTFTYDQVNRIVTAAASTYSQSSAHCWGETYTYDQWANMSTIGAISSSYTGCTQDNLSVSVTTNNQLSSTGFSYDAAGNMTGDNTYTYGYNAESEIKSAAGVNYTYDGDGNRLEKSNGKLYWYGAGTEILDESDLSGNFTNEYVFFGGKRIAIRNVSSGTIDYYEEDMLGSSRTMVQAGGTSLCFDADFLPFGYEKDVTTTCTQNYKFEGKERDTETLNDDFGARYYTFRLGRWLSADWSSVPAPVPYANLTNPQTLNLYAMVSDNPESFADLDGHCGHLSMPGAATATEPCGNPGDNTHDTEGDGNTGIAAFSCEAHPESCDSSAQVSAQSSQIAAQEAAKGQNAQQPTVTIIITSDEDLGEKVWKSFSSLS